MMVKYFLIFILSLLLISCSESGYAFKFDVEEVETTITINEDECRDVLEKGNLIASAFRDLTKNKSTNPKSRIYHNIFMSLIVFKGFIYEIKIDMEDNELRCYFKYKLTQNN
tara:strand:+ start:147 stop:482 length:336 start_codon:yes stop_codon:yes gene_type:complete